MLEFICGNGLDVLSKHFDGLVLTDCPKPLVRATLTLAERNGLIFISAYASDWLMKGKYPGEKAVQPYLDILHAFPDEKLVIDPFMGSGTTGIAAVLADRDFIGVEINEERCDYAKLRVQNAFAGANPGQFR